MKKAIRTGIITISDRSFRGEREDLSGPALQKAILRQGWKIQRTSIVQDEMQDIIDILMNWCDSDEFDLILTSGGTGFAPRDITPEATMQVIQRSTPGLSEGMRSASMKITPHAMLSRGVSGIREKTLIVNLPGSPKAAVENLEAILPVLGHAVSLIRDDLDAEAGHSHKKSNIKHI